MNTPTEAAIKAAKAIGDAIVRGDDADATFAAIIDRETGLPELLETLKIADAHIGWGDCSLENVHSIVRAVIAKFQGKETK